MELEIVKITIAFFVLMNPFAALATFLESTLYHDAKGKLQFAFIVSVATFITIVFFTLLGDTLLDWLGISTAAFRIAGGIMLFLIAINMMNGSGNPNKPELEDLSADISYNKAAAVVPITIPMIMGPGGISTVIIYSADAANYLHLIYIIIAGLCVCVFNFVILTMAAKVSKFLGRTGLDIMSRIMGLLVAAVSVEIVLAGLRGVEKFW